MKNILLLGDSIRMGYDSFVRNKLLGRANIFYPEDNGRFAQHTLRQLSEWKGALSLPQIDVVHWNNGLWDVLHLNAASGGHDGEAEGKTISPPNVSAELLFDADPLTPPDIYRYYIGRVLTRIRQLFPGAEVVFATTTPVIEKQANWAYRSNSEIDDYNRIAREVLTPQGVRINELGNFARKNCEALHRDWVHYSDEGSTMLADEIIAFFERERLI